MKTALLVVRLILLVTFVFLPAQARAGGGVQGVLVYIGTYTNAKSKGIYAYRQDRRREL